jgi:hypothetical protein
MLHIFTPHAERNLNAGWSVPVRIGNAQTRGIETSWIAASWISTGLARGLRLRGGRRFPVPPPLGDGGVPRSHAQLGVDPVHVILDRFLGEEELSGDFAVGAASGNE